jgi:hypothetical protein
MVVLEPDQKYGVELEVFFTTHQPIPDHPDHYVKSVKVRATQVTSETRIVTTTGDRQEMESIVPAGAWIIQNPAGELYYNSPEEFGERYEGPIST